MKYAKLFSIFVFVVMAIYGLIGLYFLPLASFDGDLTRTGKLPESMFGWTKQQPAIEQNLLQSATWQEADVLVIGDSFTSPRIWQTVLTRHNLRVRTEDWTSVRGICGDFTPWLHMQGFRGQYVIIEVVERNAEDTLSKSAHCNIMKSHPLIDKHVIPPATLYDRQNTAMSGRLSIGIQTELNVLKYNQLQDKPDFMAWDLAWDLPNGVRIKHLPDGCDLFSHQHCQDVLFLGNEHPHDYGEDMLAIMEKINARLDGFIPIWVIVPDKSTVYLRPDKKFWDKAEIRFHAPNILRTFRQAIQEKTVDLYPANDTHLSTTGYLMMGDAIYQGMGR